MVEGSVSTLGCSPVPPVKSDPSTMEEGKFSPSPESIEHIIVSPTNSHKVIAEFVGTYIIVFTGCGCIIVDKRYRITTVGVAVGWGLAVMVMIYTLGHVSGGHFNPAVTIAFAASRKFPWRQVLAFIASQLAGSVLAILTLSVVFHSRVNMRATVTQYLGPTTVLEALTWEFIISFILMLTICGVATDNRAINELSGVTVGATVLFNFLLAGNITGASMNPARSIGAALVCGEYRCLGVYIIGPILGTITASVLYSILRHPLRENGDKEISKSV
ncbi:hypothetical protein L1049_002971 [Liquidambar formosana]|uniref:Aquaporin NIP-type n=1 Tax=Liquidambar formosana TaxID=63359 RepID=A0AAP0NFZ0_LIQFO